MIEALKQKLGEEVEKLQYELNFTLPNETRKAVEHGDLRENSEYKAALELLRVQRKLVSRYWHDANVQVDDFTNEGIAASSSWPAERCRTRNTSRTRRPSRR